MRNVVGEGGRGTSGAVLCSALRAATLVLALSAATSAPTPAEIQPVGVANEAASIVARVPADWGTLEFAIETSLTGLYVVEQSPLLEEPGLAEHLSTSVEASSDAASALLEWLEASSDPSRTASVTTLWRLDDVGARLAAGRRCGFLQGELVCEDLDRGGLAPSELRATISAWKRALLARILWIEDPADAGLMTEIARYELFSGDRSVYRAWVRRLGDWDCAGPSETKDACERCCAEHADDEKTWACNFLVGSLASIGGYCLGGGPAGGPGSIVIAVLTARLLTAACHEIVNEKKLRCDVQCSEKYGDADQGLSLRSGY